jgi:hypothetical protein
MARFTGSIVPSSRCQQQLYSSAVSFLVPVVSSDFIGSVVPSSRCQQQLYSLAVSFLVPVVSSDCIHRQYRS